MNIMKNSKEKNPENYFLEAENEALKMSVVKMFVEKYPNDMDLGEAVRKFVSFPKELK